MSGLPAQIGEHNNFLTLVSLHERKRGGYRWTAQCDCGKTTIVTVRDFRSGHTKSCGCFSKARKPFLNRKHGMSESAEFRTWCHLIGRCHSTSDHKYKYYGGRGITVCARWKNDFAAFYLDVGPRPSSKHSLDRIDNNKGYSPENCRWATRYEQAQNKSSNVYVILSGVRLAVAEVERRLSLSGSSISQRVRKYGETHQEALDYFIRTCAYDSLDQEEPPLHSLLSEKTWVERPQLEQ